MSEQTRMEYIALKCIESRCQGQSQLTELVTPVMPVTPETNEFNRPGVRYQLCYAN